MLVPGRHKSGRTLLHQGVLYEQPEVVRFICEQYPGLINSRDNVSIKYTIDSLGDAWEIRGAGGGGRLEKPGTPEHSRKSMVGSGNTWEKSGKSGMRGNPVEAERVWGMHRKALENLRTKFEPEEVWEGGGGGLEKPEKS